MCSFGFVMLSSTSESEESVHAQPDMLMECATSNCQFSLGPSITALHQAHIPVWLSLLPVMYIVQHVTLSSMLRGCVISLWCSANVVRHRQTSC